MAKRRRKVIILLLQGMLLGIVMVAMNYTSIAAYANSSLISYTKISLNKTKKRLHAIDTITIHCAAGQCSVEGLGDIFALSSRKVSSNYGIGKDGRIGLYVDEKDRSWCSSNADNDHRAVTIEVASDRTSPYTVNDKVYAVLIDLVTDICQRNDIKKLVWSWDKNTRINHLNGSNMTVHRDYANKSCPGDYLYNKHDEIVKEVNKRLRTSNTSEISFSTMQNEMNTDPSCLPYKVKVMIPDLNIRKGPGINYAKTGQYTRKGIFTIVKESRGAGSAKGWGKLKSGAGWISLDYCKRI